MELDFYTRIGLLLAGLLLLLFVNVDITYVLSRLLFRKTVSENTTNEKEFLNMVNLWYKLKEACEKHGFIDASNKLDEVFPLLNVRSPNDE